MSLFNQVARFGSENAIYGLHRAGHHPADRWARGFGIKILPPVVKSDPPWVRNGKLGKFQFAAVGVVPEETSVGRTDRAVGGFDVTDEKHARPHVNSSRWIGSIRMVCMMRVVVVEAA